MPVTPPPKTSPAGAPSGDETFARREADVLAPPAGLRSTLRHLGPGLIITASIVGSGELILTTHLGAEAGLSFLWLILFSCFIKVFVQIELARYTISSGQTALEAFNRVPGPRLGASWVVWWWAFMVIASMLQLGGIVGGVGQAVQLAVPLDSVAIGSLRLPFGAPGWVVLVSLSGIIILYRGRYRLIERVSTVMVFCFTAVTVGTAILLQWTEYAVEPGTVLRGLRPTIPPAGLGTAFAVFGITGVGASELIYYPYWCLEKGYARFTGPRDPSEEWARRARQWVRVLKTDAWLSMAVYTISTVAFYLLGAGVLHARGELPDKSRMMAVLSGMYVHTLGRWGMAVFLVGSFAVLYSTFFVATASNARVIADGLNVSGMVPFRSAAHRRKWVSGLCVLFPVLCGALYLFWSTPVRLIKMGATVQALTLPVIAAATIYLRCRHTDPRLRPGRLSDALLAAAAIAMAAVSMHEVLAFVRLVG